MLHVGAEVKVRAVSNALQLTPRGALEVERVLDVHGALGVVGELLLRVLVQAQVIGVNTEVGVPLVAQIDPVLVPLLVLAGLDKELHLHLLELAGAEDEVTGGDLVPEALTNVANAERDLGPRGGEDVLEVHKDALRGLGAQVVQALFVVDRPEERLEHAGEVARLGPVAGLAGLRVVDIGQAVGGRVAMLLLVGLQQVIGTVALVRVEGLNQRIVEHLQVPGGDPRLARQDHRRIDGDGVRPGGDHRAPPLALDVFLHLHTVRAVVPRGARATVDLTTGVHKPTTLAQIYYAIQH